MCSEAIASNLAPTTSSPAAPTLHACVLCRQRDRDPAESSPSLTNARLVLRTSALILLARGLAGSALRAIHRAHPSVVLIEQLSQVAELTPMAAATPNQGPLTPPCSTAVQYMS